MSIFKRKPMKQVGLLRRYFQDAVDDIASVVPVTRVKKSDGMNVYLRPGMSTDNYIRRRIFKRDRFAQDLTGEGDTVVVANAVNGPAAMKASKKVGPNGKVIALEPATNNYGWLKKNIEENQLDNVETYKMGMDGVSGEREIRINDINTGAQGYGPEVAGFATHYEGKRKEKSETVPTATLHDVWQMNNIEKKEGKKVHLILDNEYSDGDPRVLEQIKELRPDTVAMEIHMNQGLRPNYDEVVGKLEEAGYEVNHLSSKLYRKVAKQGFIYAKLKETNVEKE